MPVIFILMLYINYLSGTGKINDISAGGVSALYPTFFTPAGYTFSIWGIIYLFNFVFVVYYTITGFSASSSYPTARILIFYSLSCIFNISWVFAWHYDAILISMFMIASLFAALLMVYQEVTSGKKSSFSEYFVTTVPVSIYLGWIVVAVIANAAVTLRAYHWGGFGIPGHYWAAVMIVVAGIVNVLVLLKKRDVFFSLVFLWAALGIIVARRAEMSPESDMVAVTAMVTMGIVFIFILIARFVYIKKEKITAG